MVAVSAQPGTGELPQAVSAAIPQTVVPVTMDLTELTPALDAAGIELAQTDPAKLAAVQARIASEKETRPLGRERPPRAKVEEVPLVQVQTRH
jgi:ribonuclease E